MESAMANTIPFSIRTRKRGPGPTPALSFSGTWQGGAHESRREAREARTGAAGARGSLSHERLWRALHLALSRAEPALSVRHHAAQERAGPSAGRRRQGPDARART